MHAARPDAPAVLRARIDPAPFFVWVILAIVGVGVGIGATNNGWYGWVGAGAGNLTFVVINALWKLALMRHPGTREFRDGGDAARAAVIYRRMRKHGLGFAASDAWDQMSRASIAEYQMFDRLCDELTRLVESRRSQDPNRAIVAEYTEQVRLLTRKLGEPEALD